jgi:hypothetical protein
MFKLIQRGQVYADSHGWPVLIHSSDTRRSLLAPGSDQHGKH